MDLFGAFSTLSPAGRLVVTGYLVTEIDVHMGYVIQCGRVSLKNSELFIVSYFAHFFQECVLI